MERLISTRGNLQYVPESYILPPERRPEKEAPCIKAPVIDLGGGLNSDNSSLSQQIIKAGQEFGFFQVVNHGIPIEVLDDVMQVAREFYELPIEEKARLYSEDPKQSCRLYTSLDYASEDVHYWRDILKHHCHPLEEHIQNWPHNPTQYRDVIGSYSLKARKLSLQLLDLICAGLGLDSGYFNNELSGVQVMAINQYPPCPDPSLTLGLPKHCDVNLISVLYQVDKHGLQVLKDGHWFEVEPLPGAFVVNIGTSLQVVSNGKLMSVDHRVVTRKSVARTTVSSFIHPSQNCVIEPAKALVDGNSTPLYKSFDYKSFITSFMADTQAGLPPLEQYKLK